MTGDIRLVVLDMDGTLLDDAKEVGPRTAAAIRAGAERGVRFLLASARPFCSARPYAAALGLDSPLICYNGALVRTPTGREVVRRPLPAEVARALAERCRAEDLYAKVYDDDLFFVAAATEETLKYSRAYRVPYRAVGDLAEHIAASGLEPLSFVIHADPVRLPSLRAEIEERFAGRLNCHCPNEHALHISSPEASKLAAVRLLAEEWGIAPAHVLAVGDGDNDLEVVRWAGIGVAVGNASPDLLAAADWVAPDNNRDGVGAALERFLLMPAGSEAPPAAAAGASAAAAAAGEVAPGAAGGEPAPAAPGGQPPAADARRGEADEAAAGIVVERSVAIDAPPARVWEVFAAIDRWPRWNPVCLAAGHVAGRRWSRGASIRVRFRFGPLRFTVKPRLIAVEPGRRVVWTGNGYGLQGLHAFHFEEDGGGTRVTSREVFSGPLLPLARAAGFPRLAGRMIDAWLAGLKREAERPD